MRLLTLDWSEPWSRLALYQTWRGARYEKLDGTNPKGWSLDHNVTEQAEGGASAAVIGQCVKERYRTMRGYPTGSLWDKRKASIRNVSSLCQSY